ncbi:SusC/RagA family TonB-linked outer membrane protein [Mucilaginibacter arboris]|uniref:SusC/RagA family TonB-linked outer membrane protein n=1 Tax=Mucilaginibacter arboris TaxID=2682090 RepID=A0A7K1SSC4_9SPHI|nr:SusC/RagA family TonB-linked outer membrane protein [Mucilaginibacter arboris]MVN20219.1 SusC/RagA family TonB-linked outer membrane protein [Mucilaginibacter arboris]
MKQKLLKLFLILFALSSVAFAQRRTITGVVTGKQDGLPLPGVSVIVKGTKTGTQTGPDGSYSIKADPGQSLVFTFIGFNTQTVTPSSNRLDVTLSGQTSELNEVVVVGYGTQVRRDNIGSITPIKGRDLAEVPVQNFEQALGGRAAGAQVTIPNGLLNAPPVINIRGINSLSLSSQPLFVIDGVPSYTGDVSGASAAGNALGNINPDDIESIDIAKDGSATAIYGSRAANGVVFVTTKKGKKGKAVVTLDSWYGISKVQRLPKLLNAEQYVMMKNEALGNAGYNLANTYFALETDANGKEINTNWNDYVYRTGKAYSNSVSVSGGSENTTYYLSANYSNQNGILAKNSFNRTGVTANLDHKVSNIISMGGKISYSDEQNLAATTSGSQNGEAFNIAGLGRIPLVSPPNVSPYNNDGSYNLNGNALGLGNDKGVSTSYYNIVPVLDMNRSNNEVNHVSSNFYFQLKPLSWITLKTTYGIDYLYSDNDIYQNPYQGDGYPNGSATDSYTKYKRWVWDNTAQFDKGFGKNSFSLLLGNEQQRSTQRGFGLNRTVISDPAFNVIQAGWGTNNASGLSYGENYLVSFFGRLNYDFDKKYFLSGTIRQDEYSAFGANSKKGYFPGVGLGWEITRENFWHGIGADKVFSSFKIRASYAKVGNNTLSDYQSFGLYNSGLYNGTASLAYNQTGNPQLGWETSKKTDIGFNFGVLNDRITGEVAYYKNNISDMLYGVNEAPSAGLPSNPVVNIASMYNRGLEITLNANAVQNKNFSWTPSFNISFNQNKLTSLSPGLTSLTSITAGSETVSISQVGSPIGDLYIVRTAGVDPATGRRIFINGAGQKVYYQYYAPTGAYNWTYADGTKAPAITQATDAVNYKKTSPTAYGGFSNTFRYKSFDLNILFTYSLGGYVYYGTGAGLHDQRFWNNTTDILNRWTAPGQVTNIPKVVYGDNVSNGSTLPLDINVYKGDFLKFKSGTFGYSLPKSLVNKVGISNLRVYLSAYNLFVITKYPGPDPEVSSNGTGGNSSQGIDRNTAANQRTITAGLQVKF